MVDAYYTALVVCILCRISLSCTSCIFTCVACYVYLYTYVHLKMAICRIIDHCMFNSD